LSGHLFLQSFLAGYFSAAEVIIRLLSGNRTSFEKAEGILRFFICNAVFSPSPG
jgi:hypothetical protein